MKRQGDILELKKLIGDIQYEVLRGNTDIDILGIENDSRKIKKGYMFVAIKGFSVDGHEYIHQAIDKGAVCIMVERDIDIRDDSVTVIKVQNTLDVLAYASSLFYGEPSKKLNLIGVTGTNGKTSVTYLVKRIFEENSKKTSVIGTLGSIINDKKIDNKNTTPDSLTLQRLFSRMVDEEIEFCVMEVSSHALDLKRVEHVDYQVGIFTNLTEDHLDYHITMENYYKSKLKLFNITKKYNIINVDDTYGKRMINEISNNVPLITYGFDKKSDVTAKNILYSSSGVEFNVLTPKGSIPIHMKLLGKFNVYNALAAISCGIAYDVELHVIKKAIESMDGIKGRFELIPLKNKDFSVIIDYAHTPDGLEKVLTTIKQFAQGRVVVVFGAGGNRDKEKRPIMGEIVSNLADMCIVTSDNPRFEDPDRIIEDILAGVKKGKAKYIAITDRKEAIRYALENAKPKDIILLAGKGHETYTIIKDKVIPFNEKQIVLDILKNID